MEHIRDSLRFKVRLESLASVPQLLRLFLQHNISVVKVDFDKFICSKEFGWRPLAIDLRFPSGLLVEFYAVPRDMDQKAVKGPNHQIFQDLRNMTLADKAGNASAYASQAFLSVRRYTDALWEWTKRQGVTR